MIVFDKNHYMCVYTHTHIHNAGMRCRRRHSENKNGEREPANRIGSIFF